MWFKKIVSRLLFPVPLGLEMLAAGLLLGSFTRHKRLGQFLVIAGTLWFAAIGYPWAARWFLPGLTRQYPPLSPAQVAAFQPRFIGVPGMGVDPDSRYPANLRFPAEFMLRLLEAVRLSRLAPQAEILVSISNLEMSAGEKRAALSELMVLFGADPRKATVLIDLRDTEGEIQEFQRRAGKDPVCLVSSAANLPRAMMLARRHGLNALPSPSSPGGLPPDPRLRTSFSIVQLFPCAENVGATELAFYEGLGVAFESLKSFLRRGAATGNAAAD